MNTSIGANSDEKVICGNVPERVSAKCCNSSTTFFDLRIAKRNSGRTMLVRGLSTISFVDAI